MIINEYDQIVRLINNNLNEIFGRKSIFCNFLVEHIEDYRENSIVFAPHEIFALHHLSKGKVFILHVYDHRKEVCNYICKRFGLKFIEKNYRKQYLCFETDDLKKLLTVCTLICKK